MTLRRPGAMGGATQGRSVAFVAGGYGRDRGRGGVPPSAAGRHKASFWIEFFSMRRVEREPTRHDVDELVAPATPHFAYQLRARVEELIAELPPEHEVRRYGEEQ